MNASLPKSDPETRLNTVQAQMAKAEIRLNVVTDVADTVDDAEVLSLIAVALRRAGVKQDYAASRAGVKPSQLSGALNGHGGFNVRWLWRFPPEFWNEFLPLLRAKKEQSADATRLQRKERLIHVIELLLTEVA